MTLALVVTMVSGRTHTLAFDDSMEFLAGGIHQMLMQRIEDYYADPSSSEGAGFRLRAGPADPDGDYIVIPHIESVELKEVEP